MGRSVCTLAMVVMRWCCWLAGFNGLYGCNLVCLMYDSGLVLLLGHPRLLPPLSISQHEKQRLNKRKEELMERCEDERVRRCPLSIKCLAMARALLFDVSMFTSVTTATREKLTPASSTTTLPRSLLLLRLEPY